jgi:deoxycytidylate deaminase
MGARHQKYLDMLCEVAETVEPVARQRMAAAVVLKNHVISVGINKRKTHPVQQKYSKHKEAIWLHAEIDAIIGALRHISPEELSQCTMYVARVKRPDDNPNVFVEGLAKPCEGCQHALEQFGIKKVYYTK